MLKRSLSCLAVLLAFQAVSSERASGQSAPPTVVVQIRSLDAVMQNIKLLVTLSGQENIAQQVEGLIKRKIGPNGLAGIDPARPFGVYGRVKGLADANAVFLVPIADEKAFLDLLENLNVKAKKNAKTGIYTVSGEGVPTDFYLRFSDKYAHVTALSLDALDTKNLLPPSKVFRAKQKSAIGVVVRLDQLPEEVRVKALVQFEQGIQEAQEKRNPKETPAQKALRIQASKELIALFNSVIQDGRQVSLDIDVNKTSKEMTAAIALTGQPGSPLARKIADFGKNKSLFNNLLTSDVALRGSVSLGLPMSVQKLFADAIDEAQAKILGEINDPNRRKQTEKLLKSLAPTFKAGELDTAFAIQGPTSKKLYNVIGAVKLHKGAALHKTLRGLLDDVLQQIPPELRTMVELDVATVKGATIHRFDLGKFYGAKEKLIFGESPLLIALSDNAVYFATGPDAMVILRLALMRQSEAKAAPLNLEVSLAKIWPLLPETDKNREKLQEMFSNGQEGTIRLAVEGGETLSVRVSGSLSLVQFLGKLGIGKN